MTYNEKRLEYFHKALKAEEKKLARWEKFFDKNKECEFTQAYQETIDGLRERVNYYRDVVGLLEGANNEQR